MGFELTPRERRWFDAVLVLGAVALGFIVSPSSARSSRSSAT